MSARGRFAVWAAGLAAGCLVAGCGGSPIEPEADAPDSVAPSPRETSPAPAASRGATSQPTAPGRGQRLDRWEVGARELPLRADGYGAVRPTPAQLRVRRLPTTDLLAPPPGEQFHASIRRVTPAWARRTSLAWMPGCPVELAELRVVRLTFRGFDGLPHTGQLVVHRRVAEDVVEVFGTLYRADYPIEQMRLIRLADLEAPPTGDGNNTAAYACRATRGASTFSAHASGLAIDVNPFMNPYVDGDLVLPELASAYTKRQWRRPGMVYRGDVVTRAFADIGWTWGGDFGSVTDPMHFTATGR